MAGHSHWANIKRKKAANDKKRSILYSKAAKMIMAAIREGGANPDTNSALRIAIEYARQVRMPKENIERLIQKQKSRNLADLQEIIYEGFFPPKIPVLIKVLTDNPNRTLTELRTILNKEGGSLAAKGAVLWQFKQVGKISIKVEPEEMEETSLRILDIASDIEDMQENVEKGLLNIYVPRDKLKLITEAILQVTEHVIESKLEYVFQGAPDVITVDANMKKAIELKEKIESLDDVSEVWVAGL